MTPEKIKIIQEPGLEIGELGAGEYYLPEPSKVIESTNSESLPTTRIVIEVAENTSESETEYNW